MTPKICCYGVFWAIGTWKTSECRERLSLNSSSLAKEKAPLQKLSAVVDPSPRNFINQGRLTSASGEETRHPHPTQTLGHKRSPLPPTLLRARSPLLKIIPSLPRGWHPELSCHLSLNSKPSQGVTHFSLGWNGYNFPGINEVLMLISSCLSSCC